nr:MAG TPA: hypothetical protein [Caudoviricetes sp.]
MFFTFHYGLTSNLFFLHTSNMQFIYRSYLSYLFP